MKVNKLFKEIENIVKENNILKNNNPIEDGNGNIINSVFTTSEEMDIKDMIESDNYTINEIIEIIKQW